jgi:opacity protein-like surface antigen
MTNKTTTICCAVALLATTAATPAFSQAKNFEGPSISLGASAVGTNTDVNITTTPDVGTFNFGKNISAVPFVDASYVFPANGNFMFGLGARYDFAKNKSGGISDTSNLDNINTGTDSEDADVFDDITVTSNLNMSYKDHKSIYLMPMYLVNNSSALFAKLGYHETKGTLRFTQNIAGITAEDNDARVFDENTTISGSKNFQGYGVGLGFRTVLSNNLYLQIEAEMVDYDKESVASGNTTISFKPKPLSASLSLGYKF